MGSNFSAMPTKCSGCEPTGPDFDQRFDSTLTHTDDQSIKVIYHRSILDKFINGEELLNGGDVSKSYNCAFCGRKDFSAEELQLHLSEIHLNHADGAALVGMLEKMRKEDIENRTATEIRCQEKSRGGLSYEVILAEPAPNVAVPKRPVTPGKNVSVEEIEQKLKAAEERRISLEAKKMADISNKLAKVEEATRKKDEITNEFITQTKEQLESKMELHVEKREAIISDMKEKLKIHAQEIEKTRETLEQQKANEQKAIEEKLKIAQSLRDENIKKMLDRLKEHNTIKIAEIKSQNDQLECQKLEEKARIYENKLFAAEQNREKELQKKIEKVQKLERRAELVRQNKAQAQDLDGQQSPIASSG
ncbi:stress response protein NST1 isoform X1 [Drosophila santomea]|uniref:stress response protein NST1 isoform X1 n=1 Tax=Drosophila santomea TaxID=129105 RepID=UPI00195424B3|nr:stress response protein NST1 isoform X1 [Drosophila santomea]